MMLAIIGLCQAFAGDVFDGVLFCADLFSYEMSWMRSGTEMSLYISQLIRFARTSSHVIDFNARNKILTDKLL